jgi:hypothetical protein
MGRLMVFFLCAFFAVQQASAIVCNRVKNQISAYYPIRSQ